MSRWNFDSGAEVLSILEGFGELRGVGGFRNRNFYSGAEVLSILEGLGELWGVGGVPESEFRFRGCGVEHFGRFWRAPGGGGGSGIGISIPGLRC